MSKKSANRPVNQVRVQSMLLHYLAAFDSYIPDETQGDPQEIIAELYDNPDYPPDETDNKVIKLWHTNRAMLFRKVSEAPRRDKMKLYNIAAATFNNQLMSDQAGDRLLGIEPCRISEKLATAGAIQRCVSRELKKAPNILIDILKHQ